MDYHQQMQISAMDGGIRIRLERNSPNPIKSRRTQ